MINKKLPIIRSNLQLIRRELEIVTPKLDDDLDETTSKLLFINNMLYIMSKGIADSINSRGIWRNVGMNIGNTFDTFMKDTIELNPFSTTTFPDAEIKKLFDNYVGYGPSAYDKTYLLMERCLTDEHRQPIKLILPYAEKCMESLIKIISHSVDDLSRLHRLDMYPIQLNRYNMSLNNFPKLRNYILDRAVELLEMLRYRSWCNVNHMLSIHEKMLIWYDQKDVDDVNVYYSKYQYDDKSTTIESIINEDLMNETKIELKHEPNKSGSTNPEIYRLRTLLRVCFNKIVKMCQDSIYKALMSDIVKEFEYHFFIEINTKFVQMPEDKLNELFYETDDFIKKKKVYDNMTKKIDALLKQSDNI
jgi:hypothetical protein